MNELKIIETVAAKVSWDKETALKEANEIMKKYDGLVFTEEDLPEAKKELATLRKVSKEINSQALKIDKELSKEIKQFRNEVKEVKTIVDSGVNYIAGQVNAFEESQAKAKRENIIALEEWQEIKDYYEFNDKWLLKKYDDKMILTEIAAYKKEYNQNISSIKMLATSHNMESVRYIEMLKSTPLELVLQRIIEDTQLIKQDITEKPAEVKIETTQAQVIVTRKLKGTIQALTMLKEYAEKIGVEWSK